jgi:hypothetical protein
MFIHGSPITADFPQDLGLKDRFWYWFGASGKKYIHSIYPLDQCPPLPGAIYVAVRCTGCLRTAVAVGKFPPIEACAMGSFDHPSFADLGVTEIHVHLLARNATSAQDILSDLQEAFRAEGEDTIAPSGFHEPSRNSQLASVV